MFNFTPVSQSTLVDISVIGTISPNQLPIFIASGPTHNIGAVPDPGPVSGTNRFLCEDASWTNPPGSGTVTSVGLQLPTAVFSTSGTPVSGIGTIVGSFVTQAANTVFSGPASGVNATPVFRFLSAADIPNIDFAKIATGTVPVLQGGTGGTTASTARSNLSAAIAGANSDITSLSAVTTIVSPSAFSLSSIAPSGNITLSPGSSGLVTIVAPPNMTNVLRLDGGVTSNNKTALLFFGANAATDIWAIGNGLSNSAAQVFEIFDLPASTTRLQVSSSGTLIVPTGDIQTVAVTTSQARTVTCRNSGGTAETKITYYGTAVAGNIFSSIPFAGLGALAFTGVANAVVYTTASVPMVFGTNSIERIRITGTGKVGFGNASPLEVVDVTGNVKASGSFIGDASQLTGLIAAQIPNIDASKITTGTLAVGRIPSLDASIITTGAFATARIPSLDASIITSGTLTIGRGGTGAGTQAAAINNLLPTQTGQSGKSLQTDGSNVSWVSAAGSVTSVGAGNLTPLFTTSVTNNTTTPVINFSLTNATANSWFGNPTGSSGAPSYNTTPLPAQLLPANIRYGTSPLAMTSSTPIDWSLSAAFTGTLINNVTITFANAAAGQSILVRLTVGGSGGYTVAWPSSVLWTAGFDPTQTTTIGKIDIYTIFYDGTNYLGSYVQNLS